MQTRRRSLLESVAVTAFGTSYAVPLNWFLINKVSWPDPWVQATAMTLTFVLTSLALKYYSRRFFNWLDVRYPSADKEISG